MHMAIGRRVSAAILTERRRVFSDFAEGFKFLAQAFAGTTQTFKTALINSIVAGFLFLLVYVSCFVVREQSVQRGLLDAYRRSWLSTQSNPYSQLHGQSALALNAISDKEIQTILGSVLREASGAARARLAIIHDGTYSITGVDLLRFDITNGVAAPGRLVGELTTNVPLSQWTPDYLPALIRHECAMQKVAAMQNPERRVRLEQIGAAWLLQCPVIDVHDEVLGALLISWDAGDTVPTGQALQSIINDVQADGRRIGVALDIRRED